jgi:cell division septation protein DedD
MISTYAEHYGNPALARLERAEDAELARQLLASDQRALAQQLEADEELAKQIYEDQVDELCHQTAGTAGRCRGQEQPVDTHCTHCWHRCLWQRS